MTSLLQRKLYDVIGTQCMPCSIYFSMTLQIKILSAVSLDFLKQIIILKSFDRVLHMSQIAVLYFGYQLAEA